MEVSKSWKFEEKELCNFILFLRIAAAATMTTLRYGILTQTSSSRGCSSCAGDCTLSLSLYSFNCIHEYWWVPIIYCCFLIELLAPRCIPKFKLFDVFFALSHFDWPMTKKILKATSGRSLHYRNRIVEVFSLCNTTGKIICLLWFVKFISSPNAQPSACTFGIVGKPVMSWCALRWLHNV